ncbi:hypothetical protein [Pseudodesulfovibrio sp.]|uniref:hypothetical protein n=1 Tax=Pseudodesulfovibrio sp. TaxID=2035812 RepID=UPI002609266F|nr:hypothetical protein [Pseudodesulfovibrio sp.]MDD3310988.1 hypothetical protein [Pseudodesulfovibrio sp.]
MSDDLYPYTVVVLATSAKGVKVKIPVVGVETWLPRSRVEIPADVRSRDELELMIPNWIIHNALGEPDY